MRQYLKRAVSEGKIQKLTTPVRYQAIERSKKGEKSRASSYRAESRSKIENMILAGSIRKGFIKAVDNRRKVSGHTHDFYRYPARFSPSFAASVIKIFSDPYDLIIDPFMGGGTTLVEAKRLDQDMRSDSIPVAWLTSSLP